MKSLVEVHPFTVADIAIIQEIAHTTWPPTFQDILSKDQIEFMLDWMYNTNTLITQIQEGHLFFGARLKGEWVGFAGLEFQQGKKKLKIHKLYVLPTAQGKGVGKKLFHFIEEKAKESKANTIALNVNRFNPAKHFYEEMGMHIIKEEDIDIGRGYLMEDFVFCKEVN